MSLKTYQQDMVELNEYHGIEPWHPLSTFAHIAEEVGELGRVLNHIYGDKIKKESEEPDDLGGELTDVLMLVIALASNLEIDLEKEWEKFLKKSRKRDKGRYSTKKEIMS